MRLLTNKGTVELNTWLNWIWPQLMTFSFIPLAVEGCHSISNKQELGRAVAEIGDWETLCENLGVEKAVINRLRNLIDTDSTIKKSRCLEAFLNTGGACWEQVVKVVADYPFYNARLASNIAHMQHIDYSTVVKYEL